MQKREFFYKSMVLLLNLPVKQFSIRKSGCQNQEKTVFQDQMKLYSFKAEPRLLAIKYLPEDKFSNENDLIVSPKQVLKSGLRK